VDRNLSSNLNAVWGYVMPKVYLIQENRDLNKLYDFIFLEMKKQKIRQKHIAAELGVTQEAVSKMLNDQTLSLKAFMVIMRMLGKDATECIK